MSQPFRNGSRPETFRVRAAGRGRTRLGSVRQNSNRALVPAPTPSAAQIAPAGFAPTVIPPRLFEQGENGLLLGTGAG